MRLFLVFLLWTVSISLLPLLTDIIFEGCYRIHLLRRKLLAGAVFALRNAVTVSPVVVAFDNEIPSTAFALLKLQSGLRERP